ncbi:MAG: phosphoribosylamine--glycine ligase [Oscillospiraceae bacterium]|nr:phosphoribosylamine--glycine ligase [Oscillospiraceae bacterium]
MKVLVVGGGGREHAVCAALCKSPRVSELHAAPGNGGISSIAQIHDVSATDICGMVKLAEQIKADYVFVTPDDPLIMGMVDALEAKGFKTFGPSKNAALIEGSKAFAKAFMEQHNIPTARHKTFSCADDALNYIESENVFPVVIKYDGPALGKGVVVAADLAQAKAAVNSMLVDKKFGDSIIVVEECLSGPEVTVLAFTDGKTVKPMPSSTDHKRAFDHDEGPNTGGMGVISPSPFYTPEMADCVMRDIIKPTIEGLRAVGRKFKGCLYFGLMLTDEGPKVIEYNCRFGDPETQTVLPLLETDLLDIMEAVHEERLHELDIVFKDSCAACVVMASGGYPGAYEVGFPISGLDEDFGVSTTVYHAGTKLENATQSATGGSPAVTGGGRVLGITAIGDSLPCAIKAAYQAVGKISFKNSHYRKDIGEKALLCVKH